MAAHDLLTMATRFLYLCGLPLLCAMYLWLDTLLLSSQKSRMSSVLPQPPTNAINLPPVTQASPPKERPIMFLHVGPHKTGTTTIQNSFDVNPVLLEKDNYKFLGMRNPFKLRDSFGVRISLREFRNSQSNLFLDNIEKEVHSFGYNSWILSSEDFSLMLDERDEQGNLFFNLLKQRLANKTRIHVAVGYRRYYEWIVSLYNQVHKFHRRRETFVKWFREGAESRSLHEYSDVVYQAMQQYFDHVEIINVHDPQDLMTNIYCHVMQNATHSCKWQQQKLQNSRETTRENPSVPLWPMAIADEAMYRRLVPEDTNMKVLAKSVQEFAFETNYTLPLQCLTKTEERALLEKSLHLEKLLLPDFFQSAQGEAELRKDFAEYVRESKFCSVDLRRVLHDEQWQDYFGAWGETNKVTSSNVKS